MASFSYSRVGRRLEQDGPSERRRRRRGMEVDGRAARERERGGGDHGAWAQHGADGLLLGLG